MEEIDLVRLNFSPQSLNLMNVILGFVVFGVALNMKLDDFTAIMKKPKPALIGLATQFFIFPALTYLLALLLQPSPSIAMGMLLIASCPGGNISNFLTQYANGNAALSVSMSAVSTAAASFMTPLNMSFWGGLYIAQSGVVKSFELSFYDMFIIIFTLLLVPTIVGLWVAHQYPKVANRLKKPMQLASMVFFIAFVVIATVSNWSYFLEYYYIFFSIVIIHNLISIATGYSIAKVSGLSQFNIRAVTLEVGIQNSGLGLIIIFNEFDGLGGMAIVAAAWGIWHIVAGLSIASYWRKKTITDGSYISV